jgi:uroporphyrinogen decarboxylase
MNHPMTNRDRALAVLRYQPVDRLPLVHFGVLRETREIWTSQGHISDTEARNANDGTPEEDAMAGRLGFDFNWQNMFHTHGELSPCFKREVVARFPDGTEHVRTENGAVAVNTPGGGSIHAEVDHTLKDRRSWEEHFRHRLQWSPERVTHSQVRIGDRLVRFDQGGLEHLRTGQRDRPLGLHCGSLYGAFRNWAGVEGTCYMLADDEPLVDEILDTIGDLSYRNAEFALQSGAKFDFAHFWEDICFKNGPLVNPAVFADKVGPHYRRVTQLLKKHGIDIVSLDCDGWIDSLIPVWIENGVNTMFPIEVGTWNASIAPWREKYGRGLLGVGGMNKRAFSRDRKAVDAEIERLRPLVELGGYIPCPDHRIPEDCRFDLIRYYCERMRTIYG